MMMVVVVAIDDSERTRSHFSHPQHKCLGGLAIIVYRPAYDAYMHTYRR